MKTIVLFLFILPFFISALSGSDYSRVNFRRYETDHQILYFSSNLDDSVVSRLIKEARVSEEFIKNLYGWVPEKKIVTIYDRETDTANGWSRSYLKNTIMLYIYTPDRYSTLSSFTNWEQSLHVHEYTHSTQIGQTRRFSRFINTLFGNLYFPGGIIPLWMIEGVAIYSESMIGGKGRLNSPLYKAYFDSFFLKENPFSLGQLSGISDHWMGGRTLYLYGTFFYEYLIDKYSSEKMADVFYEMSGDLLPVFVLCSAMNKTLGKYPQPLYEDFIEKNRERVLKERKLSSGINGSKKRFFSVFVDIGSDGYVLSGRSQSTRSIFQYKNKKLEKIVSVFEHDSFSLRDSELLVTTKVAVNDRYYRSDIFQSNIKERTINRVTYNSSVKEVIAGMENDIFYTSFRDGINRLTHSKKDGTILKEWDFPQLNSIYSINLSKDGTKIVFTGNRHNAEKNIFLFCINSKELTEIFIAGEQYSVYFHSNNELVFSSDKNGVIIPLHLNIETGKLTQLYRPQLMAIFPKIIGNDIFFIAFDNDGYYPAWYPIENIDAGVIERSSFKPVEKQKTAELEYELKRTRFYEGLFPKLLVPDYRGSSSSHTIAFSVEGESNDLQRSYTLYFSKTFGDFDRWHASIDYFDKYILPGFRWYLSYSKDTSPLKNIPGMKEDIKRRVDRFNTGVSFSSHFNGLFYLLPSTMVKASNSISVSLGISASDEKLGESKDPLVVIPEEKDRVFLTSSFSYGLSFSFNPGSYYLFSNTDRFSLRLPVIFQKSLFDNHRYITFSPSARLSLLLLKNGKLGFVTRQNLYFRFLSESYFSLGGHELDTEMLSIKTIITGGRSTPVTVRGYGHGALTGQHVYYSNNELRFHLYSINRGFGTFPLMFRNIQGALFFDIGTASKDINLFNNYFIAGVGGELKLYTFWFYRIPFVFTLGMAKGLTASGQLNWYFSFGNSF